MPIQMPSNTNVISRDPDIFAFKVFCGDAFIDNRDVPGDPSQGLTHRLRGSRDVIEQPKPSQFRLLTEVKSEILILQRARGEVQKPDLRLGAEPGMNVFDLLF